MKTRDYAQEYVPINGIRQYFLHYPGEEDTVLLVLHGGPGQTEAHFAYYGKDERLKCSVVYYDQRGCGKTQHKNRTKPEELTLDVLMDDLRETIRYLKQRYHTEKIVLLGHSWGAVLGTSYIRKYPRDVLCYIGTGQVIDILRGEKAAYDKLGESIRQGGNPKHIKAYSGFEGYPYGPSKDGLIKTMMRFRKLQGKYGFTGNMKMIGKVFMGSPVFRLYDLYFMLTMMKTNRNLLEKMFSFNVYDDTDYELPVFYLCGRKDWQTPSVVVEEYFAKVRAPKKGLYWVEDAGHMAMIDNPKGYNDALVEVLEEIKR